MPRWLNLKSLLVGMVVLLAVLRGASELTGRGRIYWHLDLRTLYREQTAFYRGTYPHVAAAPTAENGTRLRSDYPPYAFALFIPWLPPGLSLTSIELWFTLCQSAAVIIVASWAWRTGSKVSISAALFLALGILAMTGLRADLVFGNVALLTTAMLVGLYIGIERGRWSCAAACWAGAMLKPQMGWAFAWLFLNPRGWKQLVTVGAALAVLAFAACRWTEVGLSQALGGGLASSWTAILHVSERYSLVTLLATAGVSPALAVLGSAMIGSAVIAWKLHGDLVGSSALHRFAFVALVNRICAYHNVCDDLLLVFPLVWLGQRVWVNNRPIDFCALIALGVSIWAPTTAFSLPGTKVFVVALWIALAAWMSTGAQVGREASALRGEAG